MTETSRFWDGTSTGDATASPYDAATEFSQVLMALSGAGRLSDRGGVFHTSDLTGLTPSSPGANTLRIASGRAAVYGSWYQNDANIDTNIPTPGSATRIDRLVLRKSWSAQTVRLTRIAGTEGGGAPSIVQSIGVTWDVPLAQVSITTGGVMTITDQRVFVDNMLTSDLVGNVGVGVTPSAWGSASGFALQVGGQASLSTMGGQTFLMHNSYYDGSNFRAINTGASARVYYTSGSWRAGFADSVAAGNVQTYTDRVTITKNGTSFGIDTPDAINGWGTLLGPILLGSAYNEVFGASALGTFVGYNVYHDGTNLRYYATGSYAAYLLAFTTAVKLGATATSGTAGNVPTFKEVILDAASGMLAPVTDNQLACGASGQRWTAVWAVNGTIQTSAREAKTNILAVAPEQALHAVLATPIYTFNYKEQDGSPGERLHVGFLADEAHDLLSPDHESANPQTTAAVALAAIQALNARLDRLAARIN